LGESQGRIDTQKLAMTLAVTLIAGVMLWQAGDFPDRVALFPIAITTIILVLGIADLLRILRPAVMPGAAARAVSTDGMAQEAGAPRATSMAGAIAWFLGLIIPTLLVGFLIAVPVYMALSLRLQGKHSWRTVAISVVAVWSVIYFIFVGLLNLPLYDGLLL